jgi:hypothetical protein
MNVRGVAPDILAGVVEDQNLEAIGSLRSGAQHVEDLFERRTSAAPFS